MIRMEMRYPEMCAAFYFCKAIRVIVFQAPAAFEAGAHQPWVHEHFHITFFEYDARVVYEAYFHYQSLLYPFFCIISPN